MQGERRLNCFPLTHCAKIQLFGSDSHDRRSRSQRFEEFFQTGVAGDGATLPDALDDGPGTIGDLFQVIGRAVPVNGPQAVHAIAQPIGNVAFGKVLHRPLPVGVAHGRQVGRSGGNVAGGQGVGRQPGGAGRNRRGGQRGGDRRSASLKVVAAGKAGQAGHQIRFAAVRAGLGLGPGGGLARQGGLHLDHDRLGATGLAIAGVRAQLQGAQDGRLHVGWNSRVELRRRSQGHPGRGWQEALNGAGRHPAGQQVVEGGAQSVQVGTGLGLPLTIVLRRGIALGAHLCRVGGLARLVEAGDAKINQPDCAMPVNHDVGRFQVTVDDGRALGVEVGQHVAQLFRPAQHVVHGQRPTGPIQPLLQRLALDESHDQKVLACFLKEVNGQRQVGVAQIEEQVSLPLKVGQSLGALGGAKTGLAHLFDRPQGAGLIDIGGLIEGAHTTLSHFAQQQVSPVEHGVGRQQAGGGSPQRRGALGTKPSTVTVLSIAIWTGDHILDIPSAFEVAFLL